MKIENFGPDLRGKVNKYVRKYNNKYNVYLRVIFYCLTQIFKVPKHVRSSIAPLPNNALRIAIRLDGGLGDVLVYGLWFMVDCHRSLAQEFQEQIGYIFVCRRQ